MGLYVLRLMTDDGLCGPNACGDEEADWSERCGMMGFEEMMTKRRMEMERL
jgi:hypothetical protein